MQEHTELKPEQQSQLTPEQTERNRQYGPIETSLQTEAHGYKWQRETDGIHSYQHPESHRWLHIDTQGQFFDRQAEPITHENALEQARHSPTQSIAENAQSPTGSGLNLNSHGIASRAAGIAVAATRDALAAAPAVSRVIFCCFSEASAALHVQALAEAGGPCAG